MGDEREKVNVVWEPRLDLDVHKRCGQFDGWKAPMLDPEYGYQACLKTGAVERAALLRIYLVGPEILP